ncbi:putative ABC transporter ATP-binding protein [Hartmannibacter diazotrophicus]|uniref:Putative ABC transporter ATP-binding protein n=1 Tax=Hartmannibacter diazotrophicus TaxID=1482074 RepID=A0A2C9DAM7_9HYPH|nr:ABC transporter ATP-binding protein [Hartmannibacter diazotrophicus]SON57382.1 putative ABC transporter ATP-binding protein [Hartmannibacter diazotrophicus]
MEQGLARYIWTHTRKQQLWILLVVAMSMIPYFMSFDLPKQIVNGPIQGDGFDTPDATQLFMRIEVDWPIIGKALLFPGVELTRLQMLLALSMVFLLLVVVNGLFKLYINTYKGRLGERLLRRIRYELIDRVLRFPPAHFKRLKGAEVASMIKDEVEPLGGFTGDAFVSPALLGGQALTALFFIIVQNVWLGLIAGFIVVIQATFIPRMRRRLLILGRERQLSARQLAGRVGEIIEGVGTIHAYDTSNYERADIVSRLGRIFKIRYDLYQWKFFVKFLNNFLASVTPFLFYSIGGYLALQGRLDIGQLVAVIGAYKDLPGPLKDLIDWDQARQDVQIKYAQVVEQFKVDQLIEPEIQAVEKSDPGPIMGALSIANVSLSDDSGSQLLEHVTLQIKPGEVCAFVGSTAAGGDALAEALGRLIWPDSGRILVGGKDLLELQEAVAGRRITYVAADAYFFFGSLRDNLLYGLKHAPLREPVLDRDQEQARIWAIEEARSAGNPDFDLESDWIDYASAGASGPDDISGRIMAVLEAVCLMDDIRDLALRSTILPMSHPDLVEGVVELRQKLRDLLDEKGLSHLVIFFQPDAYNSEMTVGENLLFGSATDAEVMQRAMGEGGYFRQIVMRNGLHKVLFSMGREIAENALELFSGLEPDHPFFQQLTLMSPESLPEYQALLQRIAGKDYDEVNDADRSTLIRLSFAYVEPRHRFGLLTDDLMARIVDVRQQFHADLPEDMRGAFDLYAPDKYMSSATLMDNILFGRISHRHADAAQKVQSVVRHLLDAQGLQAQVLEVGLDFNLGTAGRRLTQVQRLKLNLARALLRESDFYILNRAFAGVDQRLQEQIVRNVIAHVHGIRKDAAIIWVLTNSSLAGLFDRVIVFDRGHLVGEGTESELAEENPAFKVLVN